MRANMDGPVHFGRVLFDTLTARRSGPPILWPTLRAYGGLQAPDSRGSLAAEPLGRLGSLEIRLARKAKEVRRAQKLRFRVFYEEKTAIPDTATRLSRRDVDPFDSLCEHLLVIDHAPAAGTFRRKPRVVGTYRLLRQEVAERHGGFYSAGEFEIGALTGRHPGLRFLELGRSCVLASHRNKRTVELLWHGVWAYVLAQRADVMFGCASLDGTDPTRLRNTLAYLHHFHAAPAAWRAGALPRLRVDMDTMPKDAVDPRAAWRALPPLMKGYLRIGALVGDGAVVDRQFGTTDVLIVLPVAGISPRYVQHFGPGAERHAA